jgi:alpha-L-fucosidase
MTMNRHWGYNAADKDFKPAATLIAQAADIASKGGNFLLNIGPTAQGEIPPESVDRLAVMAAYMARHAESIKGTQASPFPSSLPWGACTMRSLAGTSPRTRHYLHIKEPPADGRIVLPGLLNAPIGARVMGESLAVARSPLSVTRQGDDLSIALTGPSGTGPRVVELDIEGTPDVATPPTITADADIFVGSITLCAASTQRGVTLRYRTDGTEPVATDPLFPPAGITLNATATVTVRAFRDGRPVSPAASRRFERVEPRPSLPANAALLPGLRVQSRLLPGDIKALDELAAQWADPATPTRNALNFSLDVRPRERHFALRFTGFIDVPIAGVYRFFTASDDGSRLRIGSTLVVDNDTPHSLKEESGDIALAAGLHPIEVEFFENWGGFELTVSWKPPGQAKAPVPAHRLRREP